MAIRLDTLQINFKLGFEKQRLIVAYRSSFYDMRIVGRRFLIIYSKPLKFLKQNIIWLQNEKNNCQQNKSSNFSENWQ